MEVDMRKINILSGLCIVIFVMIGATSCNSNKYMQVNESAKWIKSDLPKCIDMSDMIYIEATDSLLSYIDTLRSLDNVFRITPNVKGVAKYYEGGKYIGFLHEFGSWKFRSMKQGRRYNCRVSLSQLTGIDTLKDLSFDFDVMRRQVQLSNISVYIDPGNAEQAIVCGQMIFNISPSDLSWLCPELLTCNFPGTISEISPTSDEKCHTFRIYGIKRKMRNAKMKIKYDPCADFQIAKAQVIIPGMAE